MTAGPLRAVLLGLAVSVAAPGGRAETLDVDRAADGAPPLQIFAVPALADALRDVAVADACPHTALPELVLADAATLAQQIERGARADVLAIDDAAAMEALAASGHVVLPQRFATDAPPRASSYWIAARGEEPHAVAAAEFVERMFSALGQARLRRHGFLPASN